MPSSSRGDPILAWGLSALLVLSILLGGGTTQGLPGDAVLQGLGALLLVAWLVRTWREPIPPELKIWLGLALVAVGWLLIQTLPLPPSWWQALPGRSELASELVLGDVPLGGLAISMDRTASLRGIFAWIAPLAVFVAAASLPWHWRIKLMHGLIALALLSVVLGFMQLAAGTESELRFYEVTNQDHAVGTFANRNHLASFMAAAFPLATAALLASIQSPAVPTRPLRIASLAGAVALLMLGVAMSRSRAGAVLMLLALAGCGLLFWLGRHRGDAGDHGRGALARKALVATMIVGVVLSLQFGLVGVLGRLAEDPWADSRWTMARTTWQAAEHYGPLGTGAGTFVPVYQSVEPAEERGQYFANRAHNDWLEWRLEGGWPLVAILLLGLVPMARSLHRTWTTDHRLANWTRAASLALGLLLVHSLVDYPLRTTAMACVAAFLLACFVVPAAVRERVRHGGHRDVERARTRTDHGALG